ncbi:MAG: hypothetical protein O4804_09940 [Trichodesmium sp. St11_bin5]|nr:hypothetical protein [Trichodesmium sp. St11_bin5]
MTITCLTFALGSSSEAGYFLTGFFSGFSASILLLSLKVAKVLIPQFYAY